MSESFDWYQIKHLESVGNLTELVRNRSTMPLSAEVATDITVCLQQGRAFFEQSEPAAMEIRPLLVFYGMLAFARAMILSRRNVPLSALVARHGLSDPPTTITLLESLEVKFESRGTFPELIDSTRELEKVIVRDNDSYSETKLSHPPDASTSLIGKSITLKEILARIPDLEKLYTETFRAKGKVLACTLFYIEEYIGATQLGVFDYTEATDLTSLKEKIASLRARYPFLNQWSILNAKKKGDVTFCTWPRNEATEFSGRLREDTTEFNQHQEEPGGTHIVLDPRSRVQPIYGNLRENRMVIIEPIDGVHVSELSLYYAGMYLLSSLVRYRPTIWANSISRRPLGSAQVDDKPLALIEQFLQFAIKRFPKMTVNAIREPV